MTSFSSFQQEASQVQLGPAGRQFPCLGRPQSSPFDPPIPSPIFPGFQSPPTHLSGEQNGSVIVLWVAVAGLVEAPLPGAEAAQRESTVVRHLWAPALLFYDQHLDHHKVDGVPDAWVLVDSGRHCHHCEDVVLPGRGKSGRMLITFVSLAAGCYLPPLIGRHLSISLTPVRPWAEP